LAAGAGGARQACERMLRLRLKERFQDPNSAVLLIRRLLTEHAWGLRKRYAIAFVYMGLTAAATAAAAYMFGHLINQAYVDKNILGIVGFGVAIAVVFIIKGLATYGQALMMARISNRIVADSQRRLYQALTRQNVAYFADRHSSEFLARMGFGAASAASVLNMVAGAIGRDAMSLIALAAVMVAQDPIMSLVTLVIAPPALLLLRKLIRRIHVIAHSQFVGGTRLLETLQETVQGIRLIKAFNLEDSMRNRLEANVAEVEHLANRSARVSNRASPLMESLGGFAVALAMIYGGYRVVVTGAAPGEFFSFLAAFLLAYEPAKRLARLNLELTNSLVGVRILFEIIDLPASEPQDAGKPALKLSTAQIEFNDVWFSYRPGEPVLRGMSFVAEPGLTTALVGPSGGGKSTVLNLMLGFYKPDRGVIEIDGQDIATVTRYSLRSQIAYVGQDVFLFHGSIRDNIALGKPGATDEEIVAAAKAAHAHEFIGRFPEDYATLVGERGTKLSGGERQRIAIARALIRNAQIILLDEATASLDSESERLVQDAMAELCRGRTTVVIAHRLNTIVHADRIMVVEGGVISESGRHDELVRKGGRYAAFYRLQVREQGAVAPIPIASTG